MNLLKERVLQDIKEEEDLLQNLENSPSSNFNNCEKKCYELLVKMEKEIGWEYLLKIKMNTFLTENENAPWENPYFKAELSKKRQMTQMKEGLSDESFYGIRESAQMFASEKRYSAQEPQCRIWNINNSKIGKNV